MCYFMAFLKSIDCDWACAEILLFDFVSLSRPMSLFFPQPYFVFTRAHLCWNVFLSFSFFGLSGCGGLCRVDTTWWIEIWPIIVEKKRDKQYIEGKLFLFAIFIYLCLSLFNTCMKWSIFFLFRLAPQVLFLSLYLLLLVL